MSKTRCLSALLLAGLAGAESVVASSLLASAKGVSAPRSHLVASAVAPWPDLPQAITTSIVRSDDVVELEFTPCSLRAPSFRLLVQGDDGSLFEATPPPSRTVRGRSAQRPDLAAAGGAGIGGDGSLRAIVALDGAAWSLERENDGAVARTRALDAVRLPDGACASLGEGAQAGAVAPRPVRLAASSEDGSAGSSCLRVCEIAFDADYEYFVENGGSVDATVADIESIVAGLIPIFESQVGTTFVIAAIVVRTSPDDPYESTDWLESWYEVQAEWTTNQAAIHRDLAHLMTGRNHGGYLGVAFVAGACDVESQYGWSRSKWSDDFADRVFVTAHEIGHNFGASHDCAESDCGIMCSTSCSTALFSAYSLAQMGSFLSTAACIAPPGQIPGGDASADLDGDCAVGSADLGLLLGAWDSPGPGDLDGDGVVGSTDLGLLLAAWIE